ncbi:MAG: fumarylacetoacetate hydrolase family protein [Planctomycetes bacterium]|nr:fumarylacetoacetate hydrolase family protein [Planctomycetota bacterium]
MAAILVLAACAPVTKRGAIDPAVLDLPAPREHVSAPQAGERVLTPDVGWMGAIDVRDDLVFVRVRLDDGASVFAVVVTCDPAADRLVVRPLPADVTPLDLLADEPRLERYRQPASAGPAALELSIREVVAGRRLGSPIPDPKRVFAVAANFPSHVRYDLHFDEIGRYRGSISASRARLFAKRLPAAGDDEVVLGPFDDMRPRPTVELPDGTARARVDYEVELGVVMGRGLDRDTVRGMTDDDLRAAVAGLVLVSDAKARNPQVYLKAAGGDALPGPDNPYRYDDEFLDEASTVWTAESVEWWTAAATAGDYLSIGPFFRIESPDLRHRARALISARSYAPSRERGAAIPAGRVADTLYLRQGSVTTEDRDHPDALYWTLPQIIRSIVEADSALAFTEDLDRLEPGDVILLGTPGGTVITAKPPGLVDFLQDTLTFLDARDWHDMFFRGSNHMYLHEGDQVFMWIEGLGFQLLTVRFESDSG